jgi:hypothetical protein
LYPHEKDFLIMDVTGEATDIAFVKKGLLTDVATAPIGIFTIMRASKGSNAFAASAGDVIDPARNTNLSVRVKDAEAKWISALEAVLRDFSSRHALPRTMFLISDAQPSEYLKRTLDAEALHKLWLSDDPLTILPVLPSHFTPYVQTKGEAVGDPILMMLALAYEKQHMKDTSTKKK